MEQNTRAGVLEQFIASRLPYSEVERRVREGSNVSKNTIEISADGYWVINGEKTEHKATGTDGKGIQSATIKNGELILTYTDGKSDNLGKIEGGKGSNGYTPYIQDGFWYINGENLGVKAEYSIADYPVQSVNNKQGDVQLTAADVGARPDTWTPSADEVGARPASWMPTATEVGAHPNTWIPTAEQVGARPDTWTPSASDVGARPNTWTPTYAEVGADKEGTASAAVSGHNTNSEAHNDIRLELKALADRITAVLDSDDTTLDELSEIVAYIKSNKSLIDSITTSKVNVADVINNLTTNVTNKPLSAAQGVALKAFIDALSTSKLDASALSTAINTALAQAKNSGEFDGEDGTSVTVSSTSVTYAVSSNGTTAPTSGWQSTVPTVSNGQYLWTKTVVNYSDGKSTTAYSVGYKGTNGKDYALTDTDKKEIAGLIDEISIIPDYWLSELETKADAIQVAMEKAGRNKSAFLWYTDAHWVNGNSKVSPKLLNYLYKNTPMTKVNFGGDIIGDSLLDTREAMKYLYEWRRAIKGLPNHHSVIGNHDVFSSKDFVDNNYRYAFMIAPEESLDMVLGDGNYYYIDNPCEKTRYLYLNYPSSVHNELVAQGSFIVNAIKSVEDGWHIVAIAHRWWQYSASSTPTTGSISAYEKEILSVFDAYNARVTRSGSNYFTSQDFTNAKGKVEFCIGGHLHVDYDLESDGGIPIIITTADANQNRVPDSTVDSGTVGTITEAAVYGIIGDYNDTDNTKITVVGVGRGTSRIIRQSAIKPMAISNITYSGATTVGTTLDKAKFSFTINYNNGTTDTINGATTVSPATIQTVGNNTITITYTEAGATVTGTVVVVGKEEVIKPTSISNIAYSGDTSVGATLDKSKFSFTVHYNNGTSANKTGATSISPTTVGAVGNNTVTVNYTENGTTVSGTITIVGTAQEPDNEILKSWTGISDQTVYNGVGYSSGSRLGSGGTLSTQSGAVVSGFIPYNGGTIEFRVPNTTLTGNGANYLHVFDSTGAVIRRNTSGTNVDGSYRKLNGWAEYEGVTYTIEATTLKITIPASVLSAIKNVAFLRVSAQAVANVTDDTFDLWFS